MKLLPFLLVPLAILPLSGCLSLSIGTQEKESAIHMDGLASGYAGFYPISKYNGTILKAGIFEESARDGEWASLDIWPLGGVGVGLLGARVRVLFLEVGAGVLAYTPRAPKAVTAEKAEKPEPEKAAGE